MFRFYRRLVLLILCCTGAAAQQDHLRLWRAGPVVTFLSFLRITPSRHPPSTSQVLLLDEITVDLDALSRSEPVTEQPYSFCA